MNKIKYSKDLLFLIPFVESVSKIVPLNKIKSIKGYKVAKGLKEHSYGSNVKENSKYSINILTHNWQKDIKQYRGITLASLLDTLAHELAHIIEYNHSYKHFRVQSLILLKFSGIIKKMGLKDTSDRFNNLR